ncbi:MAG: hypothetical protein SFV52_08840 [Saprospiraceae bacterium]|nr:hypothetical protein [Saprospiraceae bacterium]
MSDTPPVLLLAFNRPAQIRRVLDRVREARPMRLYVHVDGPRPGRPEEARLVEAVREVIYNGVDWDCRLETWFRDANAGLQQGVSEAITWFFEQEPWGIVLEDDCLPDPTFFPFAGELLRRFENDERIMHIGGSNLIEDQTRLLPASYVYSRFSFIWGWASWRRAWRHYASDLDGLEAFARSSAFESFLPDAMSRCYMLDKFRATRRRLNQTWDYAWFYTILKNDGWCIVPVVNLVENTGIGDAQATHTQGADASARLRAQSISIPVVHPENQMIDQRLEQQFFFATQKRRFRLWLWYLLYRLGMRGVRTEK